jgi:2-methylcitrate dehydratase PrpD
VRRHYTTVELAHIRRRYPEVSAATIAMEIGRPLLGVREQARKMGLRRTPEQAKSLQAIAARLDGRRRSERHRKATLVERLRDLDNATFGDLVELCMEAAAELERLGRSGVGRA